MGHILDVVAIVISALALIGSASNWTYVFWKNRVNLRIEIEHDDLDEISIVTRDSSSTYLPCIFINNSTAPVSITKIEIIDSSKRAYTSDITPQFVYHDFKRLIDTDGFYERVVESAKFPLFLEGLEAKYEIIVFDFPANISTPLKGIRIYTNKKIVSADYLLPDFAKTLSEINHERYLIKQ